MFQLTTPNTNTGAGVNSGACNVDYMLVSSPFTVPTALQLFNPMMSHEDLPVLFNSTLKARGQVCVPK